jgi:hypothetical protein
MELALVAIFVLSIVVSAESTYIWVLHAISKKMHAAQDDQDIKVIKFVQREAEKADAVKTGTPPDGGPEAQVGQYL